MKEITRDVILDLLPLYIAKEVSDDTRALVEDYLEKHPDLAKIAQSSEALGETEEIPNPLKKEDKMEAYTKAKHQIQMRIVTLAVVIASIFGVALLGALFLLFR